MAKDSSTGGNSSKGTSGMAANKNRRSNNDHDNKNRIPNRVSKLLDIYIYILFVL